MVIQFFLYLIGIAILFTISFLLYNLWKRLKKRLDYLNTIEHLVENSKDIIYYCEMKPVFQYRYISPAIETLLRPNLIEESMNNPSIPFDLIHPDDYHILVKKAAGELDFSQPIIQRWRNADGEYITFEEYATPIYKDGEMIALQGIIRNIHDKVILQQQLEHKATHDCLTELYNRDFFETQASIVDQSKDVPVAIVICDMDELKYVNDTYGHKAGDQLIKQTATLLKEFAENNVIIARVGGDEFGLLFIHTNPQEVESMIDKLQTKIAAYNNDSDSLFEINLSAGYAFSHSSIGKMEELFVHADNAMYQDKHKKRTHLFPG